jgi:hypothetical protein
MFDGVGPLKIKLLVVSRSSSRAMSPGGVGVLCATRSFFFLVHPHLGPIFRPPLLPPSCPLLFSSLDTEKAPTECCSRPVLPFLVPVGPCFLGCFENQPGAMAVLG